MTLTMAQVAELVRKWARAQAEDQEIEGALVVHCKMAPGDAAAYVKRNEGQFQLQRWDGRREAREWMYDTMRSPDGCKLNGAQISILGLFMRAHCGHSSEGVDTKIRKIIEKAEREKAKGGRISLVPKPAGGAS